MDELDVVDFSKGKRGNFKQYKDVGARNYIPS